MVASWVSGFRGWVSPTGSIIHTAEIETHDAHADRLLTRHFPGWQWENSRRFQEQGACYASLALQFRGWIQVVCDGSYAAWKLTPEVIEQLVNLMKHLDRDQPLHLSLTIGKKRFRTVGEFIERAK